MTDRVTFVRGLVLPARIGVLPREHEGPQRIRVDVAFTSADPGGVGPDALERVIDYGGVVQAVERAVASGHIKLVETLAERIADSVLAEPRIGQVTVTVAKLDILPGGAEVGVEIVRGR